MVAMVVGLLGGLVDNGRLGGAELQTPDSVVTTDGEGCGIRRGSIQVGLRP